MNILKFILNYNLKEENVYKTKCVIGISWKLSKMYKRVQNVCWKCNCEEGILFYHLWWIVTEPVKYFNQIFTLIKKILQIHIKLKSDAFLLHLLDKELENGSIIIYDDISEKLVYTKMKNTMEE